MRKLNLTLVMVIAVIISAFAQTPQAFKYQTVVRDSEGTPIVNQFVMFRFTIHVNQNVMYQETNAGTTNAMGLVCLEVGLGDETWGIAFSGIDWSYPGTKELAVEIDVTGGNDFELLGSSPLLSVPYSLFAEDAGPDDDWTISGDDMYSVSPGNVGIGTTDPEFKLSLDDDGGIIAKGEYGSGADLSTSGEGTRMFWYPKKGAFRAGHVTNSYWDDDMIGDFSFGFGYDNRAEATHSFAIGRNAWAHAFHSAAIGYHVAAHGDNSIVLGKFSSANASNAITLGTGLGLTDLLTNTTENSLVVGFDTDTATLFVGGPDHRVGVLTESPTSELDVNGTVTATTFVGDGSGLTGISGDNLGNHIATENLNTNGKWVSGDGNSEGIMIDDDGKVGIGRANPASDLHIYSSGSWSKPHFAIHDADNDITYFLQDENGLLIRNAGAKGTTNAFSFRDYNDVQLLNIHSNGNIGIGTDSPETPLHITNGSDATLAGGGYIISGDVDSRNVVIDDNEIMARNNGAIENLHLNRESGNVIMNEFAGSVGIGTGSPTSKLDVDGTVTATAFVGDGSGLTGISASNGWSIAGDDIYNSNAGNVGVGTSTPTSKLDVDGDVTATGMNIVAGSGIAIESHRGDNQLGGINWFEEGTADAQWIFPYFRGWQSENLIVRDEEHLTDVMTFEYGTGNIGVGTGSPDATLHVKNGSDATLAGGGYIISGDVAARNVVIDDNEIMARNNGAIENLHLNRDGGDVILNEFAGSVGIGTGSPTSKLDVDGTVTATAFVGDGSGLTGTNWSISGDDIYNSNSGKVGIGESLPATKFSNSSIIASDGTKSASPDGISWQVYDGNGYALGVENSASGGSGLMVDAGNHSGTGSTVAHFVSNDNSLLNIREDGNIGFGTVSPEATLHVMNGSDASLTGGGYIITGDVAGSNIVIDNNEIMARNNGAVEKLHINHSGGDVIINENAGNVGIGNTNPTSKLDVNGTVTATAFVGDGSGLTDLPDDKDWGFYGDDMINKNSGNIGIGTITPNSRLEVNGTVTATAFEGNGSGLTNLPADNDWTVSGDNMYSAVSGKVGIGTTTPSGLLTLNADNDVNSLYFYGDGTYDAHMGLYGYDLEIYSADDMLLKINEQNSEGTFAIIDEYNSNTLFQILNDGSVGIGTGSPTSKLDVNGEARIRTLSDGTIFNRVVVADNQGVLHSRSLSTMGDNLGSHTATENIDLNGNFLTGDGGIDLGSAPGDGIKIYNAGNPSTQTESSWKCGIEVAGSQGYGLFVGRADNDGVHIYDSGDDGVIVATASGNLFQGGNNGSEVFAVSNTGELFATGAGIGITSPGAYKLYCNGSAAKPGGGSWSNPSDRNLKNINGNFTRGLSEILQLSPVAYNYKVNNTMELPSDKEYIGLIAQEVEQVIPEAVEEMESGYLSVNNDPIIWTMLNAIKEQQQTIEELKVRIKELEDKQ